MPVKAVAPTLFYPLQLQTMLVTIRGTAPLMTNHFSKKSEGDIAGAQNGEPKRGKVYRNPDQEYEDSKYKTVDGRDGFPVAGFRKAMIRAAKQNGMAMTDASEVFAMLGPEIVPLRCTPPHMDTRYAVLHKKTTTIAYRAMYDEWEVDLAIEFNKRAVTVEQLLVLLTTAGKLIGVGPLRPEKLGQYGKFEIKMTAEEAI